MEPQLQEKNADAVKGEEVYGSQTYADKISLEDRTPSEGLLTRHGLKLHPQPTGDPLDPLNWSFWRKHMILGIVTWLYFLFTYITSTTVPSFPQIQELYGLSYAQVNWTVALPALGLGAGPLVWSSFADIYGRRIIFIIGTIIALVSTCGAAVASNYGGYMAARFFQGLGASPGATVGLAIVNDLFFDYERGQKLGYWVLALDLGLLVGPLIGGFMVLVNQFWINWLTAILFAALLVAEIFFLPETLYPRNRMLTRMPVLSGDSTTTDIEKVGTVRCDATDIELKRTKTLPFINVKPVPGMRHPKPWATLVRFFLTFKFPVVVIPVCIYCFLWWWWTASIITMIPAAYVQYSPQAQGLLFIGLILGTLSSEFLVSGRLSDHIIERLAKKNHGVRVPEMRLWLAYPAATLTSIGVILWGISIDKQYHWIVGQIAFFIFAAGIQMGNTIIASYIVDCYPLQSMSVIAFYTVIMNIGAFVNPFFIAPWWESSGFTMTFAAQGIITFFAGVPAIALLHKFGPAIRAKSGQPSWINPEYDSY
ncbi:MAG: hypothetical protein M1837_003204 [Sclerophora amabilis]|nr:MAG: hypothetical protein M1837_003204 [Sclerophora amabilis]